MEGVDIYDPGRQHRHARPGPTRWPRGSSTATTTARTFCITQAFFPDQIAWEKLAKALGASSTRSLRGLQGHRPRCRFQPGKHRRVAVKVIDPRGNEVMRVQQAGGLSHGCDRPERAKIPHPAGRQADPLLPLRGADGALALRPQDGPTQAAPGRRPASYWYKTEQDRLGQQQDLFAEEERDDLPLVNRLREDVRRWRECGLPRRLATSPRSCSATGRGRTGRDGCSSASARRSRRSSTSRSCGMPRQVLAAPASSNFEVTDEDIDASCCRGEQPGFDAGTADFFPTLLDQPADAGARSRSRRLGCKMATGAGKTVVMAMLIAWAFCNRGVNPSSTGVPQRRPGLLPQPDRQGAAPGAPARSSRTTTTPPSTSCPRSTGPCSRRGKVLITNWHVFAPESEHKEGDQYLRRGQQGAGDPGGLRPPRPGRSVRTGCRSWC